MSSQSRDGLALYTLAAAAIFFVLYADVNMGDLFTALLARW